METFEMDKQYSVVIYGAGVRGLDLYTRLRDEGYVIRCFLDSSAKWLDGTLPDGIPIMTLVENRDVVPNDIVIITLQNGLNHTPLALQLAHQGYRKIIFLPMSAPQHLSATKAMFCGYRHILLGVFDKVVIPYFEGIGTSYFHQCYEEDEVGVVVNLPCELIYSELAKHDTVRCDTTTLFEYDRTIYGLKFNISMFEYFGHAGDDTFYFEDELFSKTDKRVADRYSLFSLFNDEISKGLDFFINSAPRGSFNERGYINLTDGHHRTAFLAYKWMQKMPIYLLKDDYNNLLKPHMLGDWMHKIEGIGKLSSPIEYLDYPSRGSSYVRYFACSLEKVLKQPIDTVRCMGAHGHYYARLCYRKGIKGIEVYSELDAVEEALQSFINEVFCNGSLCLFGSGSYPSAIERDLYVFSLEHDTACYLKYIHLLLEKKVVKQMVLMAEKTLNQEILVKCGVCSVQLLERVRYEDKEIECIHVQMQ